MVQLTGKNVSCVVKRSSFPTLVVMVIRYQTGAWTSRSDIGGLEKRGTKSRPKENTIHSVCIHSLMTGRSGGKREWRIHGQGYANWFSKSCLYCTLKHAIPHTLFRNITSIPVLTKKRIFISTKFRWNDARWVRLVLCHSFGADRRNRCQRLVWSLRNHTPFGTM